jgi:hypothetical protein
MLPGKAHGTTPVAASRRFSIQEALTMTRTVLTTIGASVFAVALAGAQIPQMPQSPQAPQAPPPQAPASPTAGATTGAEADELILGGCLGQSGDQSFILEKASVGNERAGNGGAGHDAVRQDIALRGADADLRSHVGHEIEVHGSFEPGAMSPDGHPVFNVEDVEMVAETCRDDTR